MDLAKLRRLRPALERFTRYFDPCIKTRPSRQHLRTYLGGQLGDLPRKNTEAIALEAQVPVRTLQEFLSLHRWDHDAVARRLRQRVREQHASARAIGVIDETSFAKCGPKTAGVKRQYCGTTGKVDNCVVTVHLAYVAAEFHALVDGDLYLPEDWATDRARCAEAGIPGDVAYRPKWQIALECIDRAQGEGLALESITADELYGRVSDFRDTLHNWGLRYVVEVPCNLQGWTGRPDVEPAGFQPPLGRPRSRPCLAPGAPEPRRIDTLWHRGGPSWQHYRVKDTDKGPTIWKVRETRFYPARDEVPGPEERLLIAENVLEDETKYFLSNAPADVPREELLRIAFARWQVERLFREAKQAVGLDEFQVRHHQALQRHLILSNLSLLFLAEETEKLRGEKPAVDALPSPSGDRGAARPDAHAAGAAAGAGAGTRQDRVLAAARG